MTAEERAILHELRRELATLYGDRLEQLVLFGSRARGDADVASDMDLLVVLKGDMRAADEVARTGPLCARLSLKHTPEQ